MTADLNDLSTEELRRQAFDKAQSARDVGFFWDLAKHLRAAHAMASEDGSGGAVTGRDLEAMLGALAKAPSSPRT